MTAFALHWCPMRILYLINVDWFFVSHFLHLARNAKVEGHEVVIATHSEKAGARLAGEGFSVLELPARRGGIVPAGLFGAVGAVAKELRQEPETILTGFGFFGIVVGTLASILARHCRCVFYITGRGYAAVSPSLGARLFRVTSRLFCRLLADGTATRWIAENNADIDSLCPPRAVREGRTRLVHGAGIDPAAFTVSPMPPPAPLRVALVGRMIWSKGVDLAVEAGRRARAQGAAVELSIAGGLDPGNPAGLSEETMRDFERVPGVRWLGAVSDINALWAQHHIGVLPSRGGEGVPRSLIEAAACGRPIITTDIPGCRELADETGGWTVPVEDAGALAAALMDAARAPDLAARGEKARAPVVSDYTVARNWETIAGLFHDLDKGRA